MKFRYFSLMKWTFAVLLFAPSSFFHSAWAGDRAPFSEFNSTCAIDLETPDSSDSESRRAYVRRVLKAAQELDETATRILEAVDRGERRLAVVSPNRIADPSLGGVLNGVRTRLGARDLVLYAGMERIQNKRALEDLWMPLLRQALHNEIRTTSQSLFARLLGNFGLGRLGVLRGLLKQNELEPLLDRLERDLHLRGRKLIFVLGRASSVFRPEVSDADREALLGFFIQRKQTVLISSLDEPSLLRVSARRGTLEALGLFRGTVVHRPMERWRVERFLSQIVEGTPYSFSPGAVSEAYDLVTGPGGVPGLVERLLRLPLFQEDGAGPLVISELEVGAE